MQHISWPEHHTALYHPPRKCLYTTHSQSPALGGTQLSPTSCQHSTRSEFPHTANFRAFLQEHVQFSHRALGSCQVDVPSAHKQTQHTGNTGSLQPESATYCRYLLQHPQFLSLSTEQLFQQQTGITSTFYCCQSTEWSTSNITLSICKLFLNSWGILQLKILTQPPKSLIDKSELGCFCIKDQLL